MLAILGAAVLATAVPAHPPTPTPRDLLDVALMICPFNPSVATMRAAARDARFTDRDGKTVIALCSMYHKGRSDQARDILVGMQQGMR